MLTGYRTLIFNGLVALLGVATAFNWSSVVDANTAGIIITVIGIAGAALRFITKGPVGN